MKYNTPMNGFYNFTPELAFKTIEEHWRKWDIDVKPKHYIVGISGGVDSTCVAALACRIFSKDRVIGVSLPCDGQKDMADVDKVFECLDIKRITIDIGDMFNIGINAIENQAIDVNYDTRTNMPARIRMTMLYGIAQSFGGVVVNTCQLSEDICGYSTLFGDSAGSYAPIKDLTKTEVIKHLITNARGIFGALDMEQQALVKNISYLVEAEEAYGMSVPSGIADINADYSVKNGKYLENGKLVIVKDGKKFNVSGLRK